MVPLTALTQAWTSPEASLPPDDRSLAWGSGLGRRATCCAHHLNR